MSEQDFYADPTVFDLWQKRTGGWLSAHGCRFGRYAWSTTFLGSAIIFLGIAGGVLGCSVLQRLGGGLQPSWNHSLAQWLTVVIALLASHGLLQQSVLAWPAGRKVPDGLRALFRWCGFSAAADQPAASSAAATVPASAAVVSASDREVQAFFVEVREAGVNVKSAKALSDAGIRSAQQLRETADSQLLRIRGVGPATVRRLRVRFG